MYLSISGFFISISVPSSSVSSYCVTLWILKNNVLIPRHFWEALIGQNAHKRLSKWSATRTLSVLAQHWPSAYDFLML